MIDQWNSVFCNPTCDAFLLYSYFHIVVLVFQFLIAENETQINIVSCGNTVQARLYIQMHLPYREWHFATFQQCFDYLHRIIQELVTILHNAVIHSKIWITQFQNCTVELISPSQHQLWHIDSTIPILYTVQLFLVWIHSLLIFSFVSKVLCSLQSPELPPPCTKLLSLLYAVYCSGRLKSCFLL